MLKKSMLQYLDEIDKFCKNRKDRNVQIRTEFIRNELTGKAKWLCCEEGGYMCAHCGHPVSTLELTRLKICPKCKREMVL